MRGVTPYQHTLVPDIKNIFELEAIVKLLSGHSGMLRYISDVVSSVKGIQAVLFKQLISKDSRNFSSPHENREMRLQC